MTPTEWVSAIDAPDMPLYEASMIYSGAHYGIPRKAALRALIRAERRLAVQYAPQYVRDVLAGGLQGMCGAEYAAFHAARLRGE